MAHAPMVTLRRFAGYTLLERVGLGGSAEVFLATAPDGQAVALKRALPHEREDPTAVRRWSQAATLQGRVAGRGVLAVHDAGVVEGHDALGPWPWLAQRWVGSETWTAWLRRTSPTAAEVRCVAADLAVALRRLRRHRVVHRDLAARHVLIEPAGSTRPRAWLTDFGIAASLGDSASSCLAASPDGEPLPHDLRADAAALGRLLRVACAELPGATAAQVADVGHAAVMLEAADGDHERALARLAAGCTADDDA